MHDLLGQLRETLRERLTIISDEESRRDAERHMARLQNVSDRIEALERQLPPTIDARLRHFLQQRSYSKALEHLEAG